jgi:hypothetical protein
MATPTGYVVVMLLQEEWRRQAALERTAAAGSRRTTLPVPQRGGWLDRIRRRPLVLPAPDAR